MSEGWGFRLLGELETVNGTTPVRVGSGRLRVVLATLLLRAGQSVSRDELIDRLWGEAPPARARTTVQTHVMRLRQTLGDPGLIMTRPGGYLIEIEPERLDLSRFRVKAERAGQLDPAAASAELRAALSLWRGPALADVPSESLQRDEAPRLAEERLQALERRIECDLELGRHGEVIGELIALTAQHPYRERFWHQLMLALSRSGRQTDALESYGAIRSRLADEFGVEPGPALRELHIAILNNDDRARPLPPIAPAPMSTPRQLPADVVSFTGREADLATLDDVATRPGLAPAVIHGTAGVGKTALAVHWSHRAMDRFPDGQLYVDLHGFDPEHAPADPGAVLARLLRSLRVEAARIPVDTEEKATLYRSVTAGKRLLVLLDNAAAADQVRPLLPGSSSCLALVTSRNQLTGLVAVDGAHSLPLDSLDAGEALSLLRNLLGDERIAGEAAAAGDLVRLCGRLPLALRLVAGKLRAHPKHSLTGTVAGLRKGSRLHALAVGGDSRAAVGPAFGLSYRALPPEEQRLFQHLGLIPGPDFPVAAVAALIDAPEEHTARLLDGLALLSLVETPLPERYRLHDLVRLYSREVSEVDLGPPLRRLFDWYVTMTEAAAQRLYPHVPMLSGPARAGLFTDTSEAWAWLEIELPNLAAVTDSASKHGLPSISWRLADAIRGFFLARTYHNDMWQAVARGGLLAAEQAGDQRAQAAMHLNLGTVHWSLSDHDGFFDHSRKAADLARGIGWPAGEAKALGNAGHALLSLGRSREALEYTERAIEMWRAQGTPEGMVHALRILAHIRSEAGDLRTAERYFSEALTLTRQSGSVLNEIDALAGLGWAYWLLGETDRAAQMYTTTAAMAREQGSRFREAQGMSKLAEIACARGRAEEAAELGQRALALVRTAGRQINEVDVLNAVGRIAVQCGEPESAAEHHQRALALAGEPSHYHYGVTDALVGLADAYLRLGKHDDALLEGKRSLDRAQELGYRVLQGKAATVLAETELARDNEAQAAAYAVQALELHQATGHRPGAERASRLLSGLARP